MECLSIFFFFCSQERNWPPKVTSVPCCHLVNCTLLNPLRCCPSVLYCCCGLSKAAAFAIFAYSQFLPGRARKWSARTDPMRRRPAPITTEVTRGAVLTKIATNKYA